MAETIEKHHGRVSQRNADHKNHTTVKVYSYPVLKVGIPHLFRPCSLQN